MRVKHLSQKDIFVPSETSHLAPLVTRRRSDFKMFIVNITKKQITITAIEGVKAVVSADQKAEIKNN